MIREAPEARFWISANTEGVSCLACHSRDDGVSGTRFDHDQGIVQCQLCARSCILKPGQRGFCQARINVAGRLKSLVYGRPISVHVDPIEKKPLYHFLPGAEAFSLATAGCPLRCRFCQNWEISQARPEDFGGSFIPPQTVVQGHGSKKRPGDRLHYNEPTVFTEYLLDIARLGRKQGLRSVMISCGFMRKNRWMKSATCWMRSKSI